MIGPRWLIHSTSILAGGLWAGWLVVLGLWLIWVGLPRTSTLWIPLGVFFIAGGQFVFMVLVADRIFRAALIRGRSLLEMVAALIMGAALVGSLVSLV